MPGLYHSQIISDMLEEGTIAMEMVDLWVVYDITETYELLHGGFEIAQRAEKAGKDVWYGMDHQDAVLVLADSEEEAVAKIRKEPGS